MDGEESNDRRDQTPVVLARLEAHIASIKEDVAEIRLSQHTFVTHDRMELEVAARNNAMGQLGTMLTEHIRRAEQLERDGRDIAARIENEHRATLDRRLVPLERDRDEMAGAFKTIRFLLIVVGAVEALQVFFSASGIVIHR